MTGAIYQSLWSIPLRPFSIVNPIPSVHSSSTNDRSQFSCFHRVSQAGQIASSVPFRSFFPSLPLGLCSGIDDFFLSQAYMLTLGMPAVTIACYIAQMFLSLCHAVSRIVLQTLVSL